MKTLAFLLILLATSTAGLAETLKLAVTTSFHNSGLSDVLLPQIKADTGLEVQLLIVGTGQALRLGEAGDVDAILVHSKRAEETFVAAGHGTHRREIMYNDFVLIGPEHDPARLAKAQTIDAAMQSLATAGAPFVSRGDNSGTHKKEIALWQQAGLDPAGFEDWYKSAGSGMGTSLNTAAGLGAYILADRASWLNFANKADLALLYQGDSALFNQYSYLPVHPARHPHVKAAAAKQLETWLVSPTAQVLIDGYKIAGEQLFYFNASTE